MDKSVKDLLMARFARGVDSSGITLPLEIRAIDRTCIVCLEELRWPVFCPQCKQGACHGCLEDWFRTRKECPKCRYAFINLGGQQRTLYACPRDGKLVQFYCKDCLECFGDHDCRLEHGHGYHHVVGLDELRDSIKLVVGMLKDDSVLNPVVTAETFERMEALLAEGTPLEMACSTPKIEEEISKLKGSVQKRFQTSPGQTFQLQDEKFYEQAVSVALKHEKQSFSVNDFYGNKWKITVYRKSTNTAYNKFVNILLKLVQGQAMRYEHRFSIHDKVTGQSLVSYYNVNHFSQKDELNSAGVQLMLVKEAEEKAAVNGIFTIQFSVRPTDMLYNLKCAERLRCSKTKQNDDYLSFSFSADNILASMTAERVLFSDIVYDQQNIAWRVQVQFICCTSTHVGVYLQLLNGAEGWFDAFIRLVHPVCKELSIEMRFTHKFGMHFEWGYPSFISREKILDYLRDDQLKIEYGMRPAVTEQEANRTC